MDAYTGVPNWIKKSKKTLKQTQEWQTFMMKLYDMVHHQMHEMGVTSFNDLTPPERQLLLQRGFQALKTSDTYIQLLETASETLDESVSQEATKLSIVKHQSKTKIEILQEECHNAVTSLLQKWPDSKTSLRHCLNASIPFELRYVMWKNFLKNPKAREGYLKIVAQDPKKLVSQLDFEISQKCQTLLESDPTLKQIPNRKATCSVMRHLLSYRQTKLGARGGLIETDYLLSVPFVVCTLSAHHATTTPTSQQLTTEALATLVEEFTAFMDKRPDYMKSTQGPSLADLAKKTGALLRKTDSQLAYVIENYRVAQQQVTEVKKDVSRLQTVLSVLLHSIVRSMFVGYLPMGSVMHAWDLIVLGFDQPSYDPVPYICTTLFTLLHNDLIKCQTEKEAETVIIRGCRNIRDERLRLSINQLGFEKQLKHNLDVAEEGQFPVFHPALKSTLPPWKHWYSSKLLSQLKEERNEARTKPLLTSQKMPLSPPPSQSGSEHDQVWQLEQARLELEEESERLREEREILIAEIEEERRLRVEMQEHADEEIDRLRRQLHALQRREAEPSAPVPIPISPVLRSRENVDPPPPTAASIKSQVIQPQPVKTPEQPEPPPQPEEEPVRTPVQEERTPQPEEPSPVAEPEEAELDKKEALQATNDFIEKMMTGISFLVHGAGKSKKELDQMTKKDFQKFTSAMNKAQVSVFGKPMTDSELDLIPTPERDEKLDRVKKETVKNLFKLK